jgi:hydrogenase expression/formation protein HypC
MAADWECTEEVCLTCGDVAVPVRVVELRADGLALVDTGRESGGHEEVSVALVEAAVGDMVLVHAGEAIAVLPPQATAGAGKTGDRIL